jgi:hypothetical protein
MRSFLPSLLPRPLFILLLAFALLPATATAAEADDYDYEGALGQLKADLTRETTQPKEFWDGSATYSIEFRAGPRLQGDTVVVAYIVYQTKTLNANSSEPGRVIHQDIFTLGDAEHPAAWGSKGSLRGKYPSFQGRAQPLATRLEQSLAAQQERVLAAHRTVRQIEADLGKMSAFYAAEQARLQKKWNDLLLKELYEAHFHPAIKPRDGPGLTDKELQMKDITTVQGLDRAYRRDAEQRIAAEEATLQTNLEQYLILKRALMAARKPAAELSDAESQDLAVGRALMEKLSAAESPKR